MGIKDIRWPSRWWDWVGFGFSIVVFSLLGGAFFGASGAVGFAVLGFALTLFMYN